MYIYNFVKKSAQLKKPVTFSQNFRICLPKLPAKCALLNLPQVSRREPTSSNPPRRADTVDRTRLALGRQHTARNSIQPGVLEMRGEATRVYVFGFGHLDGGDRELLLSGKEPEDEGDWCVNGLLKPQGTSHLQDSSGEGVRGLGGQTARGAQTWVSRGPAVSANGSPAPLS